MANDAEQLQQLRYEVQKLIDSWSVQPEVTMSGRVHRACAADLRRILERKP